MASACIKAIPAKLRLMRRPWNLDVLITKERYVWNAGIHTSMVSFAECQGLYWIFASPSKLARKTKQKETKQNKKQTQTVF